MKKTLLFALALIAVGCAEPIPDLQETRALAEQGNAVAQNNLGYAYDNGFGVPEDDAEAVRWYRLAADQEYAIAQFNLGAMYDNGTGVAEDYVEAVRLFRLAADQGNANAQSGLGIMYANGNGVPEDLVLAYMWLNLAASRYSSEDRNRAVNDRDRAYEILTPDQRAEAQRLAREWDEAHPRD